MSHRHVVAGKGLKWLGKMVLLAALLLVGAGPGYARVFIEPRIVVPFGSFWAPYWAPYAYPHGYPFAYPPVVVQPPSQVYVQPPPSQPSWYYCDNPQGYYPYVEQCPRGWRQIPTAPL